MSNKVSEKFGSFGIGQILMLLAAISYAFATVYARKKAPKLEPEWQSFLQMASAFIILLPASIIMEGGIRHPEDAVDLACSDLDGCHRFLFGSDTVF